MKHKHSGLVTIEILAALFCLQPPVSASTRATLYRTTLQQELNDVEEGYDEFKQTFVRLASEFPYPSEALLLINDKRISSVLLDMIQKKPTIPVITALGELKEHSACNVLANLVENKEEFMLHEHAIRALTEIDCDHTIPLIISTTESRARHTQEAAVKALGALRSIDAIPVLIKLLKSKDNSIVKAAATSIGLIGDSSAVPLLGQILYNKTGTIRGYVYEDTINVQVRASILNALMAIGSAKAKVIAEEYRTSRIRYLDNLLKSNRRYLMASAVHELGLIGNEQVLTDLFEIMTSIQEPHGYLDWSYDDGQLYINTAKALGNIGSSEAVPHLLRILEFQVTTHSRTLIQETVVALGKIRDERAYPILIEKLVEYQNKQLHPENNNRLLVSIIQAIASFGREHSFEPIAKVAVVEWDETSSEIKMLKMNTLVQIGSERAIPFLREVFLDRGASANLRTVAARELIRYEDSQVINAMIHFQRNKRAEQPEHFNDLISFAVQTTFSSSHPIQYQFLVIKNNLVYFAGDALLFVLYIMLAAAILYLSHRFFKTSRKVCGKCGKTVPDTAKSGDICPHCGARWDYEVKTTAA